MFTQVEDENRRLLRARDVIDRSYADDLDKAEASKRIDALRQETGRDKA